MLRVKAKDVNKINILLNILTFQEWDAYETDNVSVELGVQTTCDATMPVVDQQLTVKFPGQQCA